MVALKSLLGKWLGNKKVISSPNVKIIWSGKNPNLLLNTKKIGEKYNLENTVECKFL